MKCVMSVDEKHIKRVTDKKASKLYHEGGWRYVSKSLWKEKVRDLDKKVVDDAEDELKVIKKKNNEMSISFTVSSYKTDDDKPLWKFFEYGTKDHWIEPVNAKALHWTKKGGGRPQGIYFQSSATQEGDSMFSTGHYVRGIKAREVMGRTKKRGIQKFKNLLINKIEEYNSG